MSRIQPGRHELSQNFLVDRNVIARIVQLAASTSGPLVEWGTGDGALTLPLSRLGRPLHGIDLDARQLTRLQRRVGLHVCIAEGDILRHAPPAGSTVISNVPFHLTTPVLRHLLASNGWVRAVLLLQWEVAKKRAGIGGTTQLSAQWWPWFDFQLDARVPSTCFRPRPSVDAGILLVNRREQALVPAKQRRLYQDWVVRVFAGRGRTLPHILAGAGPVNLRSAKQFCAVQGLGLSALPRDLGPQQWSDAFAAVLGRTSLAGATHRGGQ
jgi:23S rRNA (adenine-N6)-dimethyltransferase